MGIADESATAQERVRLEQRVQRQGRIAYYAWGQMNGGIHPQTGGVLRPWAQLRPAEQQVWIATATAVRSDTLDPLWANRTGADDPAPPWDRVSRGGADTEALHQREAINREHLSQEYQGGGNGGN